MTAPATTPPSGPSCSAAALSVVGLDDEVAAERDRDAAEDDRVGGDPAEDRGNKAGTRFESDLRTTPEVSTKA